MAGHAGGRAVLAAAFQAVTPRTAGFNTVDLTALSQPGQLLTILLMLTGGAPGSTAGGFKVTTLAVLLLSVRGALSRRESAPCFGRRLPDEVVHNAGVIFTLYLGFFLLGGMAICMIDGVSLMEALFESASAIATVGLSLAGTASPLCALPADFDFSDVLWPGGRLDADLRRLHREETRRRPVSPGAGDGGITRGEGT